jgi:spore coat protein U-like protein
MRISRLPFWTGWTALVGPVGLWGSMMAQAATPIPTTATFAVNASVVPGCLVVGNVSQNTGIAFGMIDFGTHSAVSSAAVPASLTASGGQLAQIQCTPGASVTVVIDAGLNAVGSQRRLKMGSYYLPYSLYTSASMATPYQPGSGVAASSSGTAMNLPVYGVATPPGSGLPAGIYSDTVQVVLTW